MPKGESNVITSTKQQVLIAEKAKLIISDKVFNKIKYLCWKFSAVEWSGFIWLDIKGELEDPENLVITVIDFTLFDIGSGAYTEFEVDEKIITELYDKYPEYMDKKYGLMHSHNSMAVFFSGTDTSTLLDQAFIHNYFVSLIVNNNYDKIAKISYKGEKEVETKETFYNRIGKVFLPYTKEDKYKKDILYVVDCNVEWESEHSEDDEELLSQIETLQAKEALKPKVYYGTEFSYSNNYKPKWHGQQRAFEFKDDFEDNPFDKVKEEKPNEKKYAQGNIYLRSKCEDFLKSILLVDYNGKEVAEHNLAECRQIHNVDYGDTPIKEYLMEVEEFASVRFPYIFKKEIDANIDMGARLRLRTILSSYFRQMINLESETERGLLEIIDLEIKKLAEIEHEA